MLKTLPLALLVLLGLVGPSLAQFPPPTQCIASASAGGSGDVITIPALPCGLTTNLLILNSLAANSTTTPTIQPLGLAAQVITRSDGTPLHAGDIPGPNYRALLNPTGFTWNLLNPATFGTLTSVAITTPSWLTVTGSPLTGTGGTIAITSTSEAANLVLASPSGSSGVMAPRALTALDMVGLSPTFHNLTLTGAQTITNGGSAGIGLLDILDNGTIGATSTDFVLRAREFESFNIATGTFLPFRFASQRNAGGIGNREAMQAGQFGGGAILTEFMTGFQGTALATSGFGTNSGIWTGINGVCSVPSGMDATTACVSFEGDVFVASTIAKKVGVSAVDINSTGSGTVIDAAFQAYKGPSAVGFVDGLLFGDDVNAGGGSPYPRFALKSGGTGIRFAPQNPGLALRAGIDFSSINSAFVDDAIMLPASLGGICWTNLSNPTTCPGGKIESSVTSGGGSIFFLSGNTILQASGGINQLQVTTTSVLVHDSFVVGSPSGGAEGAGTINATEYFINGVAFATPIANAAIATVLGSVGPTGSHTTVQEWIQIPGTGGAVRYVPGF